MEKVLQSQVSANREIARLRKPDAARTPLTVQTRDLSPADRLRLSTEITDPNKVVEAVDEIVTARMGLTPNKLGEEFARRSAAEQDAIYGTEAQAFCTENPDYYPVPQNRDALYEELIANGWDFTRNNCAIAWATLKERGNIIPWPDDKHESEPTHEPNPQPVYINGNGSANGQPAPTAGQPRPRTIATTGLRNADASATAPPPAPRKAKYTRADIERMSRADYNERLQSDPDFRRQVDAMGA
jgi:hypothetical protein